MPELRTTSSAAFARVGKSLLRDRTPRAVFAFVIGKATMATLFCISTGRLLFVLMRCAGIVTNWTRFVSTHSVESADSGVAFRGLAIVYSLVPISYVTLRVCCLAQTSWKCWTAVSKGVHSRQVEINGVLEIGQGLR